MSLLDPDLVVVVVKRNGHFTWYKTDREFWVLDRIKWRDDFIKHGFSVPEDDPTARFGIPVVNDESIDAFLLAMRPYEVNRADLGKELRMRFDAAKSWWDVGDLFPIMFVDFDRHHCAAFYPNGTPMERYLPDGWFGEFEDFATKYNEVDFPTEQRFWIQDGIDMLKVLNERGATAVH